jgi:AcrR family transcriptional regulator
MSPRPRKVSDEEVFAAATRVMATTGPAELTLGAIAAEAGVTAGALVQRFGSKRELLVAMSRALATGTNDLIAGMRAEHASAFEALYAYAACLAGLAPSPEALARNLAYLQLDLTDPELHGQLLAQARATRRSLTALVREAIDAGDLVRTADPAILARLIETTLSGSLMTWATYREGSAEKWLRRDLDLALDAFLAKRVRRARGGQR